MAYTQQKFIPYISGGWGVYDQDLVFDEGQLPASWTAVLSLSPHVAFARVCAFLLPLCVQIPLVIRTAVILD